MSCFGSFTTLTAPTKAGGEALMRIRSIKPEFWRSADTADLNFFTRLLFIGLWNYVDDNGVGEDNLNLIRSDLFPRDPIESVEELIQRGLTELSLRAQIVRYRDRKNGRRYLKVENWHHQKINRPTKSTKPLPSSENVEITNDSVIDHGGLTEDSLQDLGNEGSRDQGSEVPPTPAGIEPPLPSWTGRKTGAEKARNRFASIPTAPSALAREITNAYADAIGTPLDHQSFQDITAVVDDCLQAGQQPTVIAAGMKLWGDSDSWAPSQIRRFITKAAAQSASPTTGEDKVSGWHATAFINPDDQQRAINS